MNSNKEPPFDDREWEIQELGMLAARGDGTDAMDPAAESYRRIATALINTQRYDPPPDFAVGVVEQIAVRDAGIDRVIFRSFALVLVAASIIMAALYGDQWWQAIQEELTGSARQWLTVGTGCVVLSWMMGRLHQLLTIGAVKSLS